MQFGNFRRQRTFPSLASMATRMPRPVERKTRSYAITGGGSSGPLGLSDHRRAYGGRRRNGAKRERSTL